MEVEGEASLTSLLTMALAHVEWNDNHGGDPCTSCCGFGEDRGRPVHMGGCLVDAALTAAGLPDQPSRYALRARMKTEAVP